MFKKTDFFKKTHQNLFYLLVLFLPLQLGRHFWPQFSLVHGIRIDYLSPTIYLTDLFVLGILFSWGTEEILKIKNKKLKHKSFSFFKPFTSRGVPASRDHRGGEKCKTLFPITNDPAKGEARQRRQLLITTFVTFFLILNLFFSQNKAVTFIKSFKLLELLLLAVYIKNNLSIKQLSHLVTLLSITIIYSSLIAWLQFLKQSSIGGPFWFLGERSFNASTPGIAQVDLNGRLLLRPYATFPHPNVLGGYLTVAITLLISNILPEARLARGSKYQISCRKRGLPEAANIKKIFYFSVVFLGITALFISFSRSAWIVGGLSILTVFSFKAFYYLKHKKIKLAKSWKKAALGLILLIIVGCLIWPLIFSRLWSLKTIDIESITFRQELNQTAFYMIKDKPLFGVGLGNFIPVTSQLKKGLTYYKLQPAHNLYLLIAAETGLFGLMIFSWLVYLSYQRLLHNSTVSAGRQMTIQPKRRGLKTIKPFNYLTISLTAILLLGFFDHYFYTLQQTQLLATLIFALCFVDKEKGSD